MDSASSWARLARRLALVFGGLGSTNSTAVRREVARSKLTGVNLCTSFFHFTVLSLTKNSAEVQAATLAIQVAAKEGIKKLLLNTQNQQLVNSAGWIPGWKVG